MDEQDTEMYGWLNGLRERTGLSAATISELYLQGWIVKEEEYEVDPENPRSDTSTRFIFWKNC